MKTRLSLPFLALTLLLSGCGGGGGGGGGGGSPSPAASPATFRIAWGARTREIAAPDSALSARLTLSRAGAADVTKDADRVGEAAYAQDYATDAKVPPGTYAMRLDFYAGAGETGVLVGTAQASVAIAKNGSGIGDVVTANAVQAVSVVADQSVTLGDDAETLAFSARDVQGNLVAVSPGSARWTQGAGAGVAEVAPDGAVTTLTLGTASAKVAVDGAESVAVPFSVPPASVAVAADQTVPYGGTLRLALSGTDAKGSVVAVPAGLTTWSLSGGDGFLSLDPATGVATSTHFGIGAKATVAVLGVASPAQDVAVAKAPLKALAVAPGQIVNVGATQSLAFVATDADGKPFDPSGLSPVWSIPAGASDVLDLTPSGQATGKAAGAAGVTVAVGAVVSDATVVAVVAPAFANPGFEEGAGTIIQGWTVTGSVYAISGSGSHSGAKCAVFGGSFSVPPSPGTLSQSPTELVSGRSYRVVFWSRPLSTTDTSISVRANGAAVAGFGSNVPNWTRRVTDPFVAGPTNVVAFTGAGTVSIDDVSIEAVP